MTKPDLMLNLPPVAEATPADFRNVMLNTACAMVEGGYDPDMISRAFIGVGAGLARDLAGAQCSLTVLDGIAEIIRTQEMGGDIRNMTPAGNA